MNEISKPETGIRISAKNVNLADIVKSTAKFRIIAIGSRRITCKERMMESCMVTTSVMNLDIRSPLRCLLKYWISILVSFLKILLRIRVTIINLKFSITLADKYLNRLLSITEITMAILTIFKAPTLPEVLIMLWK